MYTGKPPHTDSYTDRESDKQVNQPTDATQATTPKIL